jgi:hypothetical protein
MADLLERIKSALDNIVTLEIVTAVGGIKKEGEKVAPNLDYQNAQVMLTKINLLQGDITTVVNEAFVSGPYQALREYHEAKAKEGYEIVQKNITTLEQLAKLAKSELFSK